MSTYEKCISKGAYELVTPGEVCTLAMASNLGIIDTTNYFKSSANYGDVRTYNNDKDDNENRTKEVCSYTSNARDAYIPCTIEHGVGFTRKISDRSKCITYDCPPGFENNGVQCTKPLEDYVITKQSHCDERWYDWFMVPNYHLGNTYYSPKVGQCYKPCPARSVPQYAKDPVDDTSAGMNMQERLDRCVNRNEYMSGKYQEGSDYCPLAWVYRLYNTPTTFQTSINTELDNLAKLKGSSNMNKHFTELRDKAVSESASLAAEASSVIENITPPNDAMMQACSTLNNPERLNVAYEICSEIKDDDTRYAEELAQMNNTPAVIAQKTKMLKQACNALFCNMKGSANDEIGKPQVCIPVKGTVEVPEEEQERSAPTIAPAIKIFGTSVSFALFVIITIISFVLFIIFLLYFLWPKVLCPIIAFLHNLWYRNNPAVKRMVCYETAEEKLLKEAYATIEYYQKNKPS